MSPKGLSLHWVRGLAHWAAGLKRVERVRSDVNVGLRLTTVKDPLVCRGSAVLVLTTYSCERFKIFILTPGRHTRSITHTH